MKLLIALVIIGGAFSIDLQTQWKNFKELHQKSYHKTEEPRRLKIFEDNLKKIEQHNKLYEKNEVSYKLGVNQFADLTSSEFLERLGHPVTKSNSSKKVQTFTDSEVPDAIDWREKGAVTEVKNQGVCAAWGYSVTGVLEGQNFIKHGKLIPLSEQELADCADENGCSGGSVQEGYEYVMEHGLASASDYPSEGSGTCHRGSIPSAVTEIGYISFDTDEEGLKKDVALIGPIAVSVDAESWQLYMGGILACGEEVTLNHGVLAVGYDSEDGQDYWLVKNSWGVNWGEEGYIRVARNGKGNCGINLQPTYPLV